MRTDHGNKAQGQASASDVRPHVAFPHTAMLPDACVSMPNNKSCSNLGEAEAQLDVKLLNVCLLLQGVTRDSKQSCIAEVLPACSHRVIGGEGQDNFSSRRACGWAATRLRVNFTADPGGVITSCLLPIAVLNRLGTLDP